MNGNRYPAKCSSCGKHIPAGKGMLAGTASEVGGWIVYCGTDFGCGPKTPKPEPKPLPVWPSAPKDNFIGNLLATRSRRYLEARGWNVDEMIAEIKKIAA